LRYLTGAAPASLRRLEELRLLDMSETGIYRRPETPAYTAPPSTELSEAQSEAVRRLYAMLEAGTPACALLHGVTGSGKTNVYIELMRRAIERGGSCLILAPEIALTPQLLERFAAHFGDRVAILHSGLSLGERMDEWKRVRAGLCDVVVGTRSAVFAPLSNLSLIILDEEHEASYKSEASPRYHAREVAKYRAVQNGALLVLGSATPSLESMYAARCGQYTYIELPARYQDRPLPAVQIADMAAGLREGGMGCIGGVLYRELRENLTRGEQSILFLNRRGASKYVVCAECRTAPECPRCSRCLVYHSVSGRLHCHLCGHSEKLGEVCGCGGELKMVGAGTQKVVEELAELFPKTPVLRLDADTTMRKGSAQGILREFARRRVPVLVGTQMVAKGLDFPGVTLVGVINADAALWAADFRAHEKTFSLITQVVGRGGRGQTPGRAVLQSYSGLQPTLTEAAAQDYHRFYEREVELRRLLNLPPFTHLTRLCLFGARQDEVLKACLRVRGWLERWIQDQDRGDAAVLGPAPASVLKVNLRYRYHLTLTAGRRETLRVLTASVMKAFPKDAQSRGVSLYADPDAEES
ncbi:MAG: primosomal protein N', partial [Oscillospiraceae bacterium]|nr:primosomal protein N' [Oscillospiraceae bacterium]